MENEYADGVVDRTIKAMTVEDSHPDATVVLLDINGDRLSDYAIDWIDVALIMPTRGRLLTLIQFARLLGTIPRKRVKDLSHYVSFTRFLRGGDKIACDWCSIVNGLFTFGLDLITENLSDPSNTALLASLERPHSMFQQSMQYLYLFSIPVRGVHGYHAAVAKDLFRLMSLLEQTKPTSAQRISIGCLVGQVVAVKHVLENVERRWCPFRHMEELEFDRSYYKLSSHTQSDLIQARNLLRTHKQVDCSKCIALLNQDGPTGEGVTIFTEYRDYIVQLSTFMPVR
jgi:hypothetical protein